MLPFERRQVISRSPRSHSRGTICTFRFPLRWETVRDPDLGDDGSRPRGGAVVGTRASGTLVGAIRFSQPVVVPRLHRDLRVILDSSRLYAGEGLLHRLFGLGG